jgi:hypothetical protein
MTRLTLYCQPSTADSLRRIPVKQWQLQRLINDAYQLRALEKYTASLEQETAISNKIILFQDSSSQVKDLIIAGHKNVSADWEARFNNQKDITKQERRGKRRWRLVAIVATGLFVWVSVSGR